MQILILILLFMCGCQELENPQTRRETYSGRLDSTPLYHAEVPLHWKRISPDLAVLHDTMTPLSSYEIEGELLTIYNFPNLRIAPEAQVERWKTQSQGMDVEVTPIANGGFGGFCMEACSDQQGMLGYAMQLTQTLYRAIPEEEPDKRSDYTIKFTAKRAIFDKHRASVEAFANSFEWITPVSYEILR